MNSEVPKKKLSDELKRHAVRARLRTLDFTIVSNNCWGAHIYKNIGEPYRTPFVGVFVAPSCYIKLVSRFRWYMSQPVRFIARSKHDYINAFRDKDNVRYPIGVIGDDVELQFLHYESETEATEKWTRRSARMTKDDSLLFFKFCDRDGCTAEELSAFDAAPLAHKVCFVSKPAPHLKSAVFIPGSTDGQVPDGWRLSLMGHKYFDAAGWLNGSDGRLRWWSPRWL